MVRIDNVNAAISRGAGAWGPVMRSDGREPRRHFARTRAPMRRARSSSDDEALSEGVLDGIVRVVASARGCNR